MTLGLDDSMLLLDALRPPPRMEVAAAVGTTFTLDLTALLAIPVAASFAESEEVDKAANLLETIRHHSERTVIFCQAGAISVPPKYRAALTFVEQSVIEVRKPRGGIFHPKFWVVRFEGGGQSRHRLLVLTRNLTFDRAWDVIVRLDEEPACEQPVDVTGLVDFMELLPRLSRQPSRRQRDLLTDVVTTLRAARLTVPYPFTSGRVVPLMPGRYGQPFHTCEHALAVSPFLTSDAVTEFLGTARKWSGVVSRRAALNGAAGALRGADAVMRVRDVVLNAQESADIIIDAEGAPSEQPAPDSETAASAEQPAMRGLHAKVYVQDTGEISTVWLGSANLTRGGFYSNLELLLELTGPIRQVGVDAILDPNGKRRDLSRLVEPHELPDDDGPAEDQDGVNELDGLAYALASRTFIVALIRSGDRWSAELLVTPWDPPPDVAIRARLLTLSEEYAEITDGTVAWHGLDLTAITPFVVLELARGGTSRTVLVRADLLGDPENRRSSVLAHAIKTREDFLRYLAALLGHTVTGPVLGAGGSEFAGFRGWLGGIRGERILEDLLTTAARAPERLASLDQTLRHLDANAATRDLVPAEFRSLWKAVQGAGKAAVR